MKSQIIVTGIFLSIMNVAISQDVYNLRLDIPLIDAPENLDVPHRIPSMNQALEWSSDLYELGFFAIDEFGDLIFNVEKSGYRNNWQRLGSNFFKYATGLAFSRWGSELPIPLGVWAHEEFHRTVLGVNKIRSYNGNWIFSRWDGTVYGVPDETLGLLKLRNNENLLYSYVAGVQYEILLNEKISLRDFYHERSFKQAALVLYNAWYVWDYFRFSASSESDSVKVLAPPHEDADPLQRDYAGSDLTAWVYDMFNPGTPYSSRAPFPGGNGVNRRIGFSDLSSDEQDYLSDQKKLSLLNFLNPSIFFINRFRLSDELSFSFFTRYSPAHFGNDVAVFLPVRYRNTGYLLNVHRFSSHERKGAGLGLGLYDVNAMERLTFDFRIDLWDQPETFFSMEKIRGGSAQIRPKFLLNDSVNIFISLTAKTRGWIIGNPYLSRNFSLQSGISINFRE